MPQRPPAAENPAQPAGSAPTASTARMSAREWLRRLGPFSVLAAIAASLPAIGAFTLVAYMQTAASWLRDSGDPGPWLYIGAFAVLSGLAVLATWPQAALGGFAFGIPVGVAAATAGCIGGAVIGYEVARRAGGDRVMSIVRERPKLAAVRDALIPENGERGFWKTAGIVALVRLPPSSPFAITNILLASLRVPRLSYLVGTAAGVLPRTAVTVWAGFTYGLSKDGDFAVPKWVWISGVVAMFVALAVIARIAEGALQRMAAGGASGEVAGGRVGGGA